MFVRSGIIALTIYGIIVVALGVAAHDSGGIVAGSMALGSALIAGAILSLRRG